MRTTSKMGKILHVVAVVLALAWAMFLLYWIMVTSFKQSWEVLLWPPTPIPLHPTLEGGVGWHRTISPLSLLTKLFAFAGNVSLIPLFWAFRVVGVGFWIRPSSSLWAQTLAVGPTVAFQQLYP